MTAIKHWKFSISNIQSMVFKLLHRSRFKLTSFVFFWIKKKKKIHVMDNWPSFCNETHMHFKIKQVFGPWNWLESKCTLSATWLWGLRKHQSATFFIVQLLAVSHYFKFKYIKLNASQGGPVVHHVAMWVCSLVGFLVYAKWK